MESSGRNIVLSFFVRAAVSVFVILTALVVAVVLVFTAPTPEVAPMHSDVQKVLVIRAAPAPVQQQWTGYGTANAMDRADVPSRVTSTVVAVPPTSIEGAPVQAGDLLVRLDDSDFARQVEITTQNIDDLDSQLARLDVEESAWQKRVDLTSEAVQLARAELGRVQAAMDANVAKQREVDAARQSLIAAMRDQVSAEEEFHKLPQRRAGIRAQKEAQEASRRLARMNVERCTIISPITGVLQSVDVKQGENITAGQRIARVVSLAKIELPVRLPASARPAVHVGDEAELSGTGSIPRSWQSTVSRIGPEDDPSTRTMTVYVELRQDPGNRDVLAPGTYVRCRVVSSSSQLQWVVPRRSIVESHVRLVVNSIIVRQRVDSLYQVTGEFPQFGLPDRTWVVLREPLPRDALIVVNATSALADGVAVEPVPADSASITAMDGPGDIRGREP